jgi:methylmalonyl-CoA/ethylmalonyl-CoA epimerase
MIADHVGIAVRSLSLASEHFKRVFSYEPMTEVVTNTRQKVRVLFLRKSHSIDLKLIEPCDETSPIYSFAIRGGGLHHLCMRCANVHEELARLNALGLRTLSGPQPGEAFENEPIAFVYVNHGLNIELIDTEKRARRL